jgi:hypothetical protein
MTDPTTHPEAPKHSTITLTLTPDSSKVHGYGYVPETQTLAVRFKGFSDGKPGLFTYHYANVTPEMFAALESAESKGAHVNAVFVKTKYPFDKLLAEAPAAPVATEHDPLES